MSGLLENGRGEPAFLCQQGGQQMLHVHLLVVQANGFGLSGLQRFLQFFGEAVGIHELTSKDFPIIPCIKKYVNMQSKLYALYTLIFEAPPLAYNGSIPWRVTLACKSPMSAPWRAA